MSTKTNLAIHKINIYRWRKNFISPLYYDARVNCFRWKIVIIAAHESNGYCIIMIYL